MKIGELASAAQCSVETIRYYEKEGLLPKADRGENNYRLYGKNHLQRLAFVRNCRVLDMSQEEIHSLLSLMDKPGSDCSSVNTLLDDHIVHVDVRIRELLFLKGQLTALRRKCHSKSKMKDCRILRGLLTMPTRSSPPQATHI